MSPILPSSGSRPYTRQATHCAMLRTLECSENAMEESALEFYENCNLNWRAQYTNPSMACLSIGNEFQTLHYGEQEKSMQYSANGDTYTENNQNGYAAYQTTGILEFLPEIASDFENIVPLSALAPH